MHEASLHDSNSFITLTYDEEHIPLDHGLSKRDLTLFFKRLRKMLEPKKIRYFACGEYGDGETKRPHYHAIIFGYDFPDKIYLKPSKAGLPLYVSTALSKCWGQGDCNIGMVSFESASYVAQYCTKKLKGHDEDSEEYYSAYNRVDPDTGEQFIVTPEFVVMSRRPGIGKKWIDLYREETIRDDYVIVNNRPQLPPKFYDKQLDEATQNELKAARRLHAIRRNQDNSLVRLQQREKVVKYRNNQFKRDL